MIPPSLTLSNTRYISRVKWSNPEKGVVPSLTPQCSSYWKGSLRVVLDNGCQLYLLTSPITTHTPTRGKNSSMLNKRNKNLWSRKTPQKEPLWANDMFTNMVEDSNSVNKREYLPLIWKPRLVSCGIKTMFQKN